MFEKSPLGYFRAKAMAAHFQERGQGRDDWERLQPKVKSKQGEKPLQFSQEDIVTEADTWTRHAEGLVEADGTRRLFCFFAQADDLMHRRLYTQ